MPRKYRIIGSLFVFLLALDQASKAVIERFFFLHESREVIPGFFNLTYVRNRGAAFGMLGTLPWVSPEQAEGLQQFHPGLSRS